MTDREETTPNDDPRDLIELQYPELHRRRDAITIAINDITAEGNVFDNRLPALIRERERVLDALRRKREGSAGKGTPHKKKGQDADDSANSGDAPANEA